jgi:replicative DNA helicase
MLMHRKDRNSEDLNLIIAKNRYGNVGTVYLDFELKTSTIEN